MVRAGSSTGGQQPTASGFVLFFPPVLMAAIAAIALSVVPSAGRVSVFWCGVVATAAVTVLAAEAVRRGRTTASLRERYAEREAILLRRMAEQQEATVQLAKHTIPDAVTRLQSGRTVGEVLAKVQLDQRLSTEFRGAHYEVLNSLLTAVAREEELRDSGAQAFVSIARRLQAIIHQQATDLRAMEDRHGSQPDFFADLLHIDHGNALIGRLADSVAVLGGARPGRQWGRTIALYSVLRGAMSRILAYRRVELHSVSDIGVVGPAVEPLIHAVAELLDNGTRYSPPATKVHLTAVEVQTGIAIEIEDAGVSLTEESRKRAERMLAEGMTSFDLNDLGETPRLGLAVVGKLCKMYGFQVSLRQSAYGGVRVVLIVPSEHLTTAGSTGKAHGIGAIAGAETDLKAPERPKIERVKWDPIGATRKAKSARAAAAAAAETPGSGSVPAAIPAPAPASASLPRRTPAASGHVHPHDDEDAPVVTEWTANGLPQRRRRNAVSSHLAPAASEDPSGKDGEEEPAKKSEQPPGMWLSAFMNSVNGEGPTAAPVSSNSDESSDKGE